MTEHNRKFVLLKQIIQVIIKYYHFDNALDIFNRLQIELFNAPYVPPELDCVTLDDVSTVLFQLIARGSVCLDNGVYVVVRLF